MNRARLVALAAGAAVLLAGAWLWRTYGLEVWLEQALTWCL
jgi:hypothetical protein